MKKLFLSATLALASCAAMPVMAACMPYESMISFLQVNKQQYLMMQGLDQDMNMLQFYYSRRTDEWTIIVTTPEGISCPVAFGDYLQVINEPQGDPA